MPATHLSLAVIGAGLRPRQILGELLALGPHVRIAAIHDPDRRAVATCLEQWHCPDALVAPTADAAIRHPDVNLVAVFSPNAFHAEHILAAFDAGKAVFSEKPLVTSLDDCRRVVRAQRETGLPFATGFVLRYAPLYRKVKELLDAGTIGRLIGIDANENLSPRHGAYIMCNWRRHTRLAGPHILEKCCHDLDLLNWFAGSVPRRIASFGGLDLFRPENSAYYRRFVHPPDGKPVYQSTWETPRDGDNPFLTDKDLYDNQVAILEYRNHVRVQFQATMSNAIEERRMYLSGAEGTIIVEMFSGVIRVRRIDENRETAYRYETAWGHAGGDRVIMEDLHRMVMEGAEPKCSGREGLISTATALGIQRAAETGRIVDLDAFWEEMERENAPLSEERRDASARVARKDPVGGVPALSGA